MADTVVKSDIVIAIHSQHVQSIVSRVKDHEYRKYLLPESVKRMWIYETSPTSAITHIAHISAGKQPGQVNNEHGLRNAEFNAGELDHLAKYAYEILDLRALPEPWTLQLLKTNGWLNGAPQKYCDVKQAMVDALEDLTLTIVFDAPLESIENGLSTGIVKTMGDGVQGVRSMTDNRLRK
jgi:hypothetical protein